MTAAPEGELERQHVRRLELAAMLAYPTATSPNGPPGRPTEIPTPKVWPRKAVTSAAPGAYHGPMRMPAMALMVCWNGATVAVGQRAAQS